MSTKQKIDPFVIGIAVVIVLVASMFILRKDESYKTPVEKPFVLISSSGQDSVVVIDTRARQDSLSLLANLGIITEAQKDSLLRDAYGPGPAQHPIDQKLAFKLASMFAAKYLPGAAFGLEPDGFTDYGDGRCEILGTAITKASVRWKVVMAFQGDEQKDSENWKLIQYSDPRRTVSSGDFPKK